MEILGKYEYCWGDMEFYCKDENTESRWNFAWQMKILTIDKISGNMWNFWNQLKFPKIYEFFSTDDNSRNEKYF